VLKTAQRDMPPMIDQINFLSWQLYIFYLDPFSFSSHFIKCNLNWESLVPGNTGEKKMFINSLSWCPKKIYNHAVPIILLPSLTANTYCLLYSSTV
jgi:hypothetical protein